MTQRFNIVLDDILDRRIDTMASIGQDTYDNGYDDGYDSGIKQGIEQGIEIEKIDTIINLVKGEGWGLDRAMSFVKIPDCRIEFVRNEVMKRLN